MTGNERNGGVGALDAFVQAGDRGEDLLGVELRAAHLLLQFVGEHVDEQLGVAGGVEVPPVDVEELLGQLTRVGEVAVVHEGDAVGRVHVEGLGLFFVGRVAACGVAHVAESHGSDEGPHVAGAIRLPNLALGLVHMEGVALGGRDAGGVLPAVLQKRQRVVNLLIDGLG